MGKRKRKLTNDGINAISTVFAILYFLPSLLGLLVGLLDANNPPFYSPCDSKLSKIEYIYPAYRIGCWLNKRPSE